MTLLISTLAAVISTMIWYFHDNRKKLKLGLLPVMFWGASLMWFVDAIFEFAELGSDYFTPKTGDMINDAFLGISVVALGLVVWIIALLISDPKGVIKKTDKNLE